MKAIFIGWQEDIDAEPFPLFNVEGGPRDKSTVTLETLKELGIEIPPYPPYVGMKITAKFIDWQEDKKPFPLFSIVGGPWDGSTVSIQTLKNLGIKIPGYPPYEALVDDPSK